MSIVDKPFAAEMVTTKGKVYKFDAIECMVQFIQDKDESDLALLLVRDYNHPDDWVDARNAFYLISKEIPSPMGGYLSAYPSKAAAEAMKAEKDGEILDWTSLRAKYQR